MSTPFFTNKMPAEDVSAEEPRKEGFGQIADSLPEGAGQPDAADNRKIRQRHRAETEAAEMRKQAYELAATNPDQAGQIMAAVEKAIEGGPSFARRRRGGLFMKPVRQRLDRNVRARIMMAARVIESRSYRHKKKGRHGGQLGRMAMQLLEALLFAIKWSRGYIAPSYAALADMAMMSRATVIKAMGVLERFGFVVIHRRWRWDNTAFGRQVVQNTNSYELCLPESGLGAMAIAVYGRAQDRERAKFRPRQESTNSTAYATSGEASAPERPNPPGANAL